MSKRVFTEEQMGQLSANGNVSKCSERSITYSKEFKVRAIQLYEQGLTSTEIFRRAGFDLDVIGRDLPKDLLRRWRRKGVEGLSDMRGRVGKGGRKKTKGLSDADKIKRLEIENAYLKAENAFLARLRAAKRTE